jgi:hypothetical protein
VRKPRPQSISEPVAIRHKKRDKRTLGIVWTPIRSHTPFLWRQTDPCEESSRILHFLSPL